MPKIKPEDISEMLKNLPADAFLCIEGQSEMLRVFYEPVKMTKIRIGDNRSKLNLVGMMMRPGVVQFSSTLEYTYFHPDTDVESEFEMRYFNWQDILFMIITIPMEKREFADKAAKECGINISDGVPHIFSVGKAESFPLDGDNTMTLENVHGHPVYNNNPAEMQDMAIDEKQVLRKHWEEGTTRS